MRHAVLPMLAALTLLGAGAGASAQTANAAPGGSTAGGNVSRTAPSGGTAAATPGQPQIGAPTPVEQQEEQKMHKDTSICKGC